MSGTMTHYPESTPPRAGALVVLGATGCIGGALVAAALEAGREVIAIGRDTDALATLHEKHAGARLTTLEASVGNDAEAAEMARRLQALDRPIGGVLAAIRGTPMRGRLLDQPGDFLRRRIDEDLLPHLFAARQLLPMLSAQGHGGYVLIGGPGADYPWAGYGHQSIAAAALRMLARVLHDEARSFGVRVQLLGVDAPLRTPANARHACKEWPQLGAVARRALAMVDRAEPPLDAVVRYSDANEPSAFWSDDIDAADTAPETPRRASQEHSSQEKDGDAAAHAERSLHDARRLLRDITTSPRLKDPLSP